MAKAAKKGADRAPDSPSSFVLVTNKRGGPILVGPTTFAPGNSVHDAAVFSAFSPEVQDALSDMVSEGWLVFGPHDAPEAPPAPPAPAVPVEPVVDHKPTLEAVKASTSAAELDAWFNMPGLSPEISEAILAQHTVLSPA